MYMEPNVYKRGRKQSNAAQQRREGSILIDDDDLDPWTAWAYKPRTITLLFIGSCFLIVHVRFSLLFMIFTLALTTRVTLGANDKDKEECTEQLVGLATCLPYVGGNAKSPTPDCCTCLKQVLNTNKKCLCVVIKDRNDPDLGLTINVTLALGLPDVCHTPANVTKCPELLKLAPNSPEAQVFYQYDHSSASGDAPASSPTASANARARGSGISGYQPIGTASGTGVGNGSGTVATWSKHKIILMVVISCIFSFTFVM